MAYLNPKTIVIDFLRNNIDDPRGRISTNSNSITATAGQTEFTITPTSGSEFSHIESVSVDSVTKTKWKEYYIDPKNLKIVFFTAMSGSEAVVISFGEGTNWIFPNKPRKTLNALSYPRMNVLIVSGPGKRAGNYEAPVETAIRFQTDIWCKEKQNNQIFTIGTDSYTGQDLAEYLGIQITEAFEEYEDELFPALYGYEPVSSFTDIPFDDEMQCHHNIVEYILYGTKIGRIS